MEQLRLKKAEKEEVFEQLLEKVDNYFKSSVKVFEDRYLKEVEEMDKGLE